VVTAVADALSSAKESFYVIPGDASPQAITRSLKALLPTRHHRIVQRQFTVLDTFDGRVRRAEARLTRDGVNGASTMVWQPRGGGSHLSVLSSQPPSFIWDLPDGPLKEALTPVIGVRRILPQADAEECGELLDVVDEREKTIARLRIASGRARLPMSSSVWQPLPTLVTLSSLRGNEGAYERLVPLIESRPGVKPCPEGPHGLMLRELGAPARVGGSLPRVDLDPTVRGDAGARQIQRALLGLLIANEPGLRAKLDTEFLHDFRVAIRRTRSLLGQIRHVFRPDVVEHFSTEFSWIGRLTGPARDLDVFVLSLREHQRDFSVEDMKALMAHLSLEQHQQHQGLVNALDSSRYRRLLSDWEAFLERPAPSEAETRNAGRLLAEVVSKRAWRLSRRIVASAGTIDEHTAATRLHEVRIDAKKLRYLVDATPAFYDASVIECILSSLRKLQQALGDLNDAHVQQKQLVECGHALGIAGGPPGAVLTLGRLAEQCHQRYEKLHRRAGEKLRQFRAQDTQSACRRAFKRGWREAGVL